MAKTSEGITPGSAGGFSGFNAKPVFTPPPSVGARTPPPPPPSAGAPATGVSAASGTPVTHLAVASERKTVHQMQQLHPYDDQWTIKVGADEGMNMSVDDSVNMGVKNIVQQMQQLHPYNDQWTKVWAYIWIMTQ